MANWKNVNLAPLLAVFVVACAGSSTGGKSSARYVANVGIGTRIGVRDISQRVLVQRNRYAILRYDDTGDRIFVETDWKARQPFEDEKSQGVIEARSRIRLETRPRLKASETSQLKVSFIGENMLRFSDSADWVSGQMSKECNNYFKAMANDFKSELSTTVRTY